MRVVSTYYEGRRVPEYSKNVFTPEWADKLYRGFARNLTRPFEFVLLTDEPKASFAEPIEVLPFREYHDNMWCILECFRVEGKVLFCGLDTVVCGNVDCYADHPVDPGQFYMLREAFGPESTRATTGVMLWRDRPEIFEDFVRDEKKTNERYALAKCPSDMKWLELHGNRTGYIDDLYPKRIKSWKAHIMRSSSPLNGFGDVRIVYFHGKEKPHRIDHPFIEEHWV